MDECLFCAIAEKKIPSYVVYEDEIVLAILDRNPANPGHVLIIPKIHVISLFELDEKVYLHCFGVARVLSQAVLQALGAKGINVLYSFGPAAGQRLPHAFIHLIPRFEGDKVQIVWDREPAKEEDLKALQSKISGVLYGSSAPEEAPKTQQAVSVEKERSEDVEEHKEEEVKKPEDKPRIPSYW